MISRQLRKCNFTHYNWIYLAGDRETWILKLHRAMLSFSLCTLNTRGLSTLPLAKYPIDIITLTDSCLRTVTHASGRTCYLQYPSTNRPSRNAKMQNLLHFMMILCVFILWWYYVSSFYDDTSVFILWWYYVSSFYDDTMCLCVLGVAHFFCYW